MDRMARDEKRGEAVDSHFSAAELRIDAILPASGDLVGRCKVQGVMEGERRHANG